MSSEGFSEKDFGALVRLVLLSGVFLCLFLFFSGFVMRVFGSPAADGLFTAGVLALLLTPALRVAMLIYGFYRLRERLFALAAVAVLGLLLGAFIL